jgi:hypothetical protein
MKVYLVNDCSSYHAGSWAVFESLKQKVLADDHEIIHITKRPLGPELPWIEECDAMVINGEGTLQQEALGWENNRATKMLEGLKKAKALGKKAYLINAVWYNMKPIWGELLRSLDGLTVREPISQRYMEQEQGVKPDVYLDLSYSCRLDMTKGDDAFAGKVVLGTIYQRNMSRWDIFTHDDGMFRGMKRFKMGGEGDGVKDIADWSYFVNSLRKAELYVTGQHHGVFAACKAQVPFAFFKVYNHKIKGVFEWAGVDIPIAANRKELREAIQFAKSNRHTFEKLFDWMAKQPVWPGIGTCV